jgi:hypothetical protein
MGQGSFIKKNKITKGKSFLEALRDRYVKEDAPLIAPDQILPDAYVVTSKGNQKSIEFVGETKIRKWQQLDVVTTITIREDVVSSAGINGENIDNSNTNDVEIANNLSKYITVDLQDNLLWEWIEVAKLCVNMNSLQQLLLHGNHMQMITQDIINILPSQCFSGLRVLALNGCKIKSWSSFALLEPLLPSIEELYLAGNSLTDLRRANAEADYEAATGMKSDAAQFIKGFTTLRLLDISSCELDEWSQVLAFSRLPNLQDLLLDGNPLPKILPATSESFQTLQRISISSSNLNSWDSVDALATYPSFHHLRLSHIPLFSGKGASEVRPIVIARIKQLSFFNGSNVSIRERTDAEKTYLRSIMRDIETISSTVIKVDINELHPRYNELNEKHAITLVPLGESTTGATLAANLVSITFKNLSFSSGGRLEPLEKKLPSSLVISKLKLMVKQLFGLDPNLQQLSLRVYKDSPPTILDDDQATLSYYGALDGAEIFINEAKA